MKSHRISTKGFSLVELLVTVFVLTVGISSALLFFTNTIAALQYARDTTLATTHAEYILEEMNTRSSLANIVASNWETWVDDENLTSLPSEVISVTFTDDAADPLEIVTSVTWVRNDRTNTIDLTTRITK